ncbi:thioredoxin-dependent thiol peroxidase [Candidatus Woesebacteria bacterium]|nr:MAG: thioredoxin-dependent thiol peroxidase [Candidatus Woesebacteria bacterium]
MALPSQNTKAPKFSLPDENGRINTLNKYRGKWVLLYFYPKDDTPGCTKEACKIRDNFSEFEKLNAVVLGVSADSIAIHKKFKEKYTLPFILLSDIDKKVINAYGVWQEKNMLGKKYFGIARTSFLINPKGNIAKVYENVNPVTHAFLVIKDLIKLKDNL